MQMFAVDCMIEQNAPITPSKYNGIVARSTTREKLALRNSDCSGSGHLKKTTSVKDANMKYRGCYC